LVARLLDFSLGDGIVEKIACPTLVCAAESDFAFAGQPERMFDRLTSPKTFMMFTDEEGAGAHCQAGAALLAGARILDWLDDAFAALPA